MIYDEFFRVIPPRNLFLKDGKVNKTELRNTLFKSAMKKAHMMLKYNNLPEEIPERMIKIYLQHVGHFAGFNHDGRRWISWGSFADKLDGYYFPTKYTVSNPWIPGLGSRTMDIGTGCIIVKNDNMAEPLTEVVGKYVDMLVENETSMIICDILARAQGLINAKDDSQYESAREYLKKIFAGETVPVKSDSFAGENLETVPFGTSHYILTDLIEYEQYVRSALWAELGIQMNWNAKRETITSTETDLDREVLKPYIDNMIETQTKDLKILSDFWGLETPITVKKGSVWAEMDQKAENGGNIKEPKEPAENDENMEDNNNED